MIQEGKKIPALNLPDQHGNKRSMNEFKGQWLVLYAYPKDLTPGCTVEAIDFTALASEFSELGTTVIGISPDSSTKHCRFIEKKELDLILLSDEDHGGLEKLGCWGLKKFMGKEYMGVNRSTWLINPEGRVARLWDKVKVKGHAQDVLDTLKELQKNA